MQIDASQFGPPSSSGQDVTLLYTYYTPPEIRVLAEKSSKLEEVGKVLMSPSSFGHIIFSEVDEPRPPRGTPAAGGRN